VRGTSKVHRDYRAVWVIVFAVSAGTLGAPGCGRPVLTLDDGVMVHNSQRVELMAHVERQMFGLLRTSVADVPVRFFAGEDPLGQAWTDRHGDARINVDVEALDDPEFGAKASVFGASLSGTGRVFEMERERVAIIVDVDHTIARTDYRALLFSPFDGKSQPIPHSQEVLNELAQDFTIIYLTGRPRAMQTKTREWLAANDYPPGPVVVASEIRDAARNGRFKLRVLGRLQSKWPNLLIGVGDRPSDARAYGANQMLALIIAPREMEKIGPHALLMPGWEAVGAFFEENHDALIDPAVVRELVAGRRPLLFTVPPYNVIAGED
jgi:hypothetical protein